MNAERRKEILDRLEAVPDDDLQDLLDEVLRLRGLIEGTRDHLRFAIEVLEHAAPSPLDDLGHHANRALSYLYAIRQRVGVESVGT